MLKRLFLFRKRLDPLLQVIREDHRPGPPLSGYKLTRVDRGVQRRAPRPAGLTSLVDSEDDWFHLVSLVNACELD
jgi:hypothetical protein